MTANCNDACCHWGVDVTPEERLGIIDKGEEIVRSLGLSCSAEWFFDTPRGGLRIRGVFLPDGQGVCAFRFRDRRGCVLHDFGLKPAICKQFVCTQEWK